MATEILSVPEEHLQAVIDIITLGLEVARHERGDLPVEVLEQLRQWCEEEQAYLDRD